MMSELDKRGEGKGRLGFDREGKEEEKEENTMNGWGRRKGKGRMMTRVARAVEKRERRERSIE